ncbi:SMP-30/gluconolactonase/LRE family protein [Mariniblastus fucicola]|uniref:L-arabinolactonase n=1 Tax=Mariniblastus fucicola TaxID=980251 RepID=A0A5B9P3F3_9BACT|nr:SMP-30/gluconolactonase/LRE family protein [Mariniblastus fucicola]QEG21097.1 L-arabinolactonase [Mariniblastus fucicola]
MAEVFDDKPCDLGEGPLWHPDRESLFWFDIDNRVMFEKPFGVPATAEALRKEYRFERTVSAAGLIDSSRLLIASEHDLFVFDLEQRSQQVLCELESENPVTRSNDGRADPFGGFWIGTMGYNAEPGAGAIYRFYKGALRQLFSDITISNAICFSPDRSRAYFTDSEVKIIWKVELDHEGWPVGDRTEFVDLRGESFAPDGAVCDADGRLWSAQWGASRVAVYSDAGELIDTHTIPTLQPTCPAFGGLDFSTLFMTTAGAHLPDEVKGTQPQAGFVFKIDGAGHGQAEHRVIV